MKRCREVIGSDHLMQKPMTLWFSYGNIQKGALSNSYFNVGDGMAVK